MTDPSRGRRDVSVTVIIPPQALLLDVAGPMEVLRRANLEQTTVRFVVNYVGPAPVSDSSVGLPLGGIEPLPEHLEAGALVVICGSTDKPLGFLPNNGVSKDVPLLEEKIVAWLRRAIGPDVRLICICSGALLAARASLLDGYECTTHHGTIEELARLAPRARILDNRLYVEDRDRLTSAGITAGIDLMLHVVAEIAGHACALAVARYLVVYLRRTGADPQLSPWLEGRNHIHPAVHRLQDAIAADPARHWSVGALAKVASTSPRNLSRLFNDHAGMSVTAFVNRMRIAVAHELVTESRLDIETVAERAGFASARQLRRAWNRLHDLPPAMTRTAVGR
ncbi:GlxA family transcriptional regulator [Bradyrhizobium erythrophlei]|uniref:GlxA family transcriptional regulator n=1 Tax=Bradyrhizobium erythrophlei TaxID=1437360 RepID=UPI0035EE6F5E